MHVFVAVELVFDVNEAGKNKKKTRQKSLTTSTEKTVEQAAEQIEKEFMVNSI